MDWDWDTPIMSQVANLDDYCKFIETPIIARKSVRLFHNPALEYLSRNHWHTIPRTWIPICILMCFKGFTHLPVEIVLSLFVAGVAWWTLLEYIFHRFLFHVDVAKILASPWALRWKREIIFVHFLLHGIHHKFPSDPLRLVFPPALTGIVLVMIFHTAKTLMPLDFEVHAYPLVAGILFGYVLYDVFHYTIHHAKSKLWPILAYGRRHHMRHHFRSSSKNYGITSSMWDLIFNTHLTGKAKAPKCVDG